MSEFATALVVLSSRLSSIELTNLIGLTPDEAWERGSLVGGMENRSGDRYRFSGVRYWSPTDPHLSPIEHLERLILRLEPVQEQITNLSVELSRRQDEPPIRLWIWCTIQAESFGLGISPVLLQKLSLLGIHLDISISFDVPEPTEAEVVSL